MSKKNALDQYYTSPKIAKFCIDKFKEHVHGISRQLVIEPSAGCGAFLQYEGNIIGCDLDPKVEGIHQRDFFLVTRDNWDLPVSLPSSGKVAVLGNPPFGFASSLAIDFFNHATQIGNTIAFIIPKTFKKDSVQNKLDLSFHLTAEYDLPKNSFILNDKEYDVPCVFQIWRKKKEKREIVSIENTYLQFISKDEADENTFCVRRVGGRSGKILEGIDHSASSTYFVKEKRKGVKDAIRKINLNVVNYTAGVRSISKNELISEIHKVMEKGE